MLKTNSKKAKANIMEYIRNATLDHFAEDYDIDPNTATDNEVCTLILDEFVSQWGHELKRNALRAKVRPIQDIFTDWGQGLPCGGLFDYFYRCTAKKTLGDILEETEEERDKYTEEKAEEWLSYLIYREVTNHADYLLLMKF